LVPVGVKFQKNANVPVSVRNLSKNYADRIAFELSVLAEERACRTVVELVKNRLVKTGSV